MAADEHDDRTQLEGDAPLDQDEDARRSATHGSGPTSATADPATIAERVRRKLEDAERALGLKHIHSRFDGDGLMTEFEDRRSEKYFRSSHIKHLPSVVRAVARGRSGMLERATTEIKGAYNGSLDENLIVAVPLCLELLQPGDGAGEVMLATTAAASYAMAGRAAALVNASISTGIGERSARMAKDLSRTFANLNRGTAAAITALERVRALKRDWSRELQLVRRGDGEDAPVEVVIDRH